MLNKVCKQSAGILLYKFTGNAFEIFLVHPGGPYWKNKDAGAWSIPKGEFNKEDSPLDAAIREVEEETGARVREKFIELSPIKQKAGKMVYAWAAKGDIKEEDFKCTSYINIEWPPKSGKFQTFPEVDRGQWFLIDEAKVKINPSQVALIDELIEKLNE